MNGLVLEYLAQRVENANGDSPNLVAAASALAPTGMNGSGTHNERARAAVREVIRPLALQTLLTATDRVPDERTELPIPAEDVARDARYESDGRKVRWQNISSATRSRGTDIA